LRDRVLKAFDGMFTFAEKIAQWGNPNRLTNVGGGGQRGIIV